MPPLPGRALNPVQLGGVDSRPSPVVCFRSSIGQVCQVGCIRCEGIACTQSLSVRAPAEMRWGANKGDLLRPNPGPAKLCQCECDSVQPICVRSVKLVIGNDAWLPPRINLIQNRSRASPRVCIHRSTTSSRLLPHQVT